MLHLLWMNFCYNFFFWTWHGNSVCLACFSVWTHGNDVIFFRNCPNPKIRGAVVFHSQGPKLFDYSIRLNHTWAFSGFPDVKSIMDVDGPYLNDLELGVNTVPIMQYGLSGFMTVWSLFISINPYLPFPKNPNCLSASCKFSCKYTIVVIGKGGQYGNHTYTFWADIMWTRDGTFYDYVNCLLVE